MSKKIIAIILALATILGCTAFAWQDATPKSEDTYARELLKALDIIDVVTDNGYAPDKVITRAELADAILRLNGYQNIAAYSSCFADVDESTPHASAIATLLNHGIIAPDVYYNPESNAKFEQAVKMIVYSLGFGVITEAQGGWLDPIMNVARNSTLLKGVSVATGTDLTADMLAVLLYNSLDCEMLSRKGISEFETIEGETLLLEKHGIKKTKGIVTSNEITTLTSASSAEGRTSIDWYEFDDDAQIMAGYLGMEAVCYYTEEDEEVVFGYPTDRNNTMTIAADDLLPDAREFSYEVICYSEETESGSTKAKKAKVESDADVIYNGKAYPDYTPEDFKILGGNLVLIDNDDDKVAEVVVINRADSVVVESVNITDRIIYGMYGEVYDLEDVEFLSMSDMYGSTIDLSALAKWNVLTVIKSLDDEYVKIVSYNDPVTGEVEAYFEEDGHTYATIDGDTFKVSPKFLAAVAAGNPNAKAISIGQSGTYYLDGAEKIAIVNVEIDSSWQYAYLMKAQLTDDGVRYRLMTDETGFKWYEGAEAVRIDEVKCEEDERKTVLDDDNQVEEERKTIPQLVKVQMNGQGFIKKIDTITKTDREKEDSLTRVITSYYTDSNGNTDKSKMREYWSVRTRRFGTNTSVGVEVNPGSSFVIAVPEKAEDLYNEDAYVMLKGNLTGQAGAIFTYNAYDADWAGVTKAAVIYGYEKSSGNALGTVVIVHSVTTSLDEDNEVIRTLNYYTMSGTAGSVPVDVDYKKSFNKGDIIGFYTNYNGEIDEVTEVFNIRDRNFSEMYTIRYNSGDGPLAYLSNQMAYYSGNVIIDKQGSYIKTLAAGYKFADIPDDVYNMPYTDTQIYSLADAAIMVYDSVAPAKERITKISGNDLSEYLYSRNSEARVVLYTTYSQLRAVIVYI